jgi:hypothetical protein
MSAKMLERQSKKCEKNEKKERLAIKKVGLGRVALLCLPLHNWPSTARQPTDVTFPLRALLLYYAFTLQDIQKGRPENARIHAENAIREKNQACVSSERNTTSAYQYCVVVVTKDWLRCGNQQLQLQYAVAEF